MSILKGELFMLVRRNKEIALELKQLPHEQSSELQKEYDYNLKCIEIIKEMSGPILLDAWRKEWLAKK